MSNWNHKYYRRPPQIELIRETAIGDILRLTRAMKYRWYGVTFTVPAGFECDGASVPRFLWNSVSPQIDPRTLAGAIGHDFLYRRHPAGWTRAEADDFFYDLIREDGLSWWKAQKAYWGVRFFGGSAWNENNKEKESELA
jgi:hypothetical protein